jgi:hypothetical protein
VTVADWSKLGAALRGVDDSLRLTWNELDALVGGLPVSRDRAPGVVVWGPPASTGWHEAGFTVT